MPHSIKIPSEIVFSRRRAVSALTALLLCTLATVSGSETFTLDTYYPSPTGIYNTMTTTGETILARNGGRVGIGTAAPQVTLHTVGRMRTGGPSAGLELDDASRAIVPAGQGIAVQLGGQERLRLTQDGNAGLGVNNPKTPAPNGQRGNADVNDIWLRSANTWASSLVNLQVEVLEFNYNDCTTHCCPEGTIIIGSGSTTSGNDNVNMTLKNNGRCVYIIGGQTCNAAGKVWLTCMKK